MGFGSRQLEAAAARAFAESEAEGALWRAARAEEMAEDSARAALAAEEAEQTLRAGRELDRARIRELEAKCKGLEAERDNWQLAAEARREMLLELAAAAGWSDDERKVRYATAIENVSKDDPEWSKTTLAAWARKEVEAARRARAGGPSSGGPTP